MNVQDAIGTLRYYARERERAERNRDGSATGMEWQPNRATRSRLTDACAVLNEYPAAQTRLPGYARDLYEDWR